MALREQVDMDFNGYHKGSDIRQRLVTFLTQVWDARHGNLTMLKDAYEAMANLETTTTLSKDYMQTVYPVPSRPKSENEEILAKWETAALDQAQHRNYCMDLFTDSPTRTKATTGNVWGLVSAVVEYENFGRKGAGPRSSEFGAGAQRKKLAFDTGMALLK